MGYPVHELFKIFVKQKGVQLWFAFVSISPYYIKSNLIKINFGIFTNLFGFSHY